jgi:hypothetical protein
MKTLIRVKLKVRNFKHYEVKFLIIFSNEKKATKFGFISLLENIVPMISGNTNHDHIKVLTRSVSGQNP